MTTRRNLQEANYMGDTRTRPDKPLLSDIEEAIGLLAAARWQLSHRTANSSGVSMNPVPAINARYGTNFHQLKDAIPFMEHQVKITKAEVQAKLAQYQQQQRVNITKTKVRDKVAQQP
jgi:hypothetical protein